MKFCLKLATTFIETFQMLKQAYGEYRLSRTQCYEWYQRYKSARTSTEDDPKIGRPCTSTDDDHVEKVHAVIRENRHLTVREVSEAGISKIFNITQFLPKNCRCIVLLQICAAFDR
jgi:hypothetical protein